MANAMLDAGKLELDLPFKGARTYLHSTNILWALIEKLGLTDAVKLEFRQLITQPIYLVAESAAAGNPAGKFAYSDNGAWRRFAILIDESRQVTQRVDDVEPAIIAASAMNGNVASAEIGRPGNFVETMVALNKMLVAAHAGAGKKPLFSSLSLDRIPGDGTIGVAITRNVGTKIYMSDVFWNGSRIGSLTFMTV